MAGLVILGCSTLASADEPNAADVEFFEKLVRPLLVARCHECHAGADHKGGLRLDSHAGVLTGGDTGPAVVPGKPDESLLVDAVRYGDTYQMPPKSQMPAAEIQVLEEWVRRGVPWGAETADANAASAGEEFNLRERAKHWSFRSVKRVEPPAVTQADWPRTTVDRFILRNLEKARLKPAPAADRRTLLRRLTFDLTGLPPTPEEIAAFLADDSPTAYETVIDRLLASPHYGERWARHWLDLVRYAETCGHEFDFDLPNAYRYRDYLIRALNADVPYDQFVIEHIAGDLLSEPRRHPQAKFNESVIGTGWYFFGEAVHSPVDVRADEANRIDNQIDVLAKTFLGLTVSCARCHDHKFDAISTKDYYALAGYLQSSRYQHAYLDPPRASEMLLNELAAARRERERLLEDFVRTEIAPRVEHLSSVLQAQPRLPDNPPVDHVLAGWHDLAGASTNPDEFSRSRGELAARWSDAAAASQNAERLVDFNRADFAGWITTGPAFGDRPARPFDWMPIGGEHFPARLFTAGAAHSGRLSLKQSGTLRSPTFEITQPRIHYRLYGNAGQVRLILDGLQLIQDPIYGGLKVAPKSEEPYWHTQDVSKWIGHRAYIELLDEGDGYLALEQVAFSPADPPPPRPNRAIAALLGEESIRSSADFAERYEALCRHVLGEWLGDSVARPIDAADRAALAAWVLEQRLLDPQPIQSARVALDAQLATIDQRIGALEARLPTPERALAIADGTAENERVFVRGSHKTLGPEVPRRFLEALGGTHIAPPPAGSGRLELARQIASPSNPLTARVIVNRLWHHHFGAGLVRSVDDFGVMGQPATHPELLDHLAGELVRKGWSLKQMHKLLVMSATYQMSSHVDPAADAIDPPNKLWHRMNSRRLEAESIRDALLAVSGRLDPTMYGPGVMPHLTEFMQGRGRPKQSGPLDGDGRRSIYLAVRRNFLSPFFLAFDYPTPFTTIGRRGTSNVPAQALSMMNNPLVTQLARHWAERMIQAGPAGASERVQAMYVQAIGRLPEAEELAAALAFIGEQNHADAATWADFAHVLFNTKEFIFIP